MKAKKARAMKPSPFLIRVLAAIDDANRDRGFTSPKWIAFRVFPEGHPGWQRSCKCGPYGSTKGSGLVMMMGGYLGKLQRANPALVQRIYVNDSPGHILTSAGRRMLDANRAMCEELGI